MKTLTHRLDTSMVKGISFMRHLMANQYEASKPCIEHTRCVLVLIYGDIDKKYLNIRYTLDIDRVSKIEFKSYSTIVLN
jgi:hypothetical protein